MCGQDKKRKKTTSSSISPSGHDCRLRPSPLQWGGIKGLRRRKWGGTSGNWLPHQNWWARCSQTPDLSTPWSESQEKREGGEIGYAHMWGRWYEGFFSRWEKKGFEGRVWVKTWKDREMRENGRGMLEAGAVSAEKAWLLAHFRLPLGKQLLYISNFIS